MTKFASIAALALATLVAVPAAAQDAEVPTYSIQTNDLDLTTAEGIARLDARVEYAAKAMCASGRRDLQAQRSEAECRMDVTASNRAVVRMAIANARKVRTAALATKTGA